MAKLIGIEPNYFKNCEAKNAVWGLSINNKNFILYYSKLGLTLQIKNDFTMDEVEELMKTLINLLVNKNNVKNDMKEYLKKEYNINI